MTEAEWDGAAAPGSLLGQELDGAPVEVELREVDELEVLLFGNELSEVALADELLLDEDLAQPPARRPRGRQGGVQVIGRDQACPDD
jgi:hypothetical protein